LIAIISFLNIFIYFIIIYVLKNYNIEDKYPKIKKFIYYYKNTRIAFILFEFILGFTCLIVLFVLSVIGFKNMITILI